ncbi:MAG: dihydrolipoyl dehydrogenase [Fimbriiglobus sp.]|jgi:dihydrolipoamide dehydrogenase|nr:dihydrolipoyl dehydrogenase [Fimbriiglobus sp.]
MAEKFDLIVIGAGPGGYVAAIRAAQLGKKVACVEKRPNKALGGTCLNVGCIPSKALLDSSELYEVTRHKLAKHGIKVNGVSLDVPEMQRRKDGVVKSLTDGISFLFKKNKVTPFYGSGKLTAPGKVEVMAVDGTKTQLEGDNVLLATGSESTELPFLKFDGKNVVSSTEALAFDNVPKHLIIVGGGYIGLELGSVWRRLGSEVTVIEFLPRILTIADGEVATQVHKILVKQGFTFHMETKVTGATVQPGVLGTSNVTVTAQQKDGTEIKVTGDKVLVAVGRRPFTAGLGLDEAGVTYDKKTGKIPVDKQFKTNVPGVYAIGDLIDGPMLAHKASEEGVAFAEMLAGHKPHLNYDCIPSAIYIWPEVASVGLTEEQVQATGRAKGDGYKVGKFPFVASGRAKAMDDTDGFVKVITDAKTDRLLGVHILGPRASDLIAEAVAVMEYKGSAEDIARMVHGHPSLTESVGEAARAAWLGMAIHA